jgi:ferredoxin
MSERLRVNPILCDGNGRCAELLPEAIMVDDWGYPIVAPGSLRPSLRKAARRAVTSCPRLALLLVPDEAAKQPVSSLRSAG